MNFRNQCLIVLWQQKIHLASCTKWMYLFAVLYGRSLVMILTRVTRAAIPLLLGMAPDLSSFPIDSSGNDTVPMGKSISNLYRYAEISKAANRRFLDAMCNIIPSRSIEAEINGVCEKKKVRTRNYTGYNVWSPETFRLFEVVCDGKYLIRGFTNQEIRRSICKENPDTSKERGRMSRELAKLRTHGLIRKIPHSRRYMVSDKGRRVMGALIETKRKIYPELAAK